MKGDVTDRLVAVLAVQLHEHRYGCIWRQVDTYGPQVHDDTLHLQDAERMAALAEADSAETPGDGGCRVSRDAVLHAALERLADDLDTEAGRYIGTPLGLTFGMLADRLRFIWRAALAEADSAASAPE